MILFLGIIFFLLVFGFDLISDFKKWITHRSVDHTFEAWQRAIFLIPSIILFHLSCPNQQLKSLLIIILFLFFTYWLFFDGFYNKLRGYDWWFMGSDDKDDAKLDNLQQWLGLKCTKILKIGGFIITFFLYIKLWV